MSADFLPWEVLAPARLLFLAHVRGDPAARALFGRGGDDDAAVEAAVARPPLDGGLRRALVDRVAAYAATFDVAGMAASVDRLRDPRAVVVVGGQQPGVGGGPLLAYAKALGVLALAERIERRAGIAVVPVWWVASEDHDVTEAGSVLVEGGRRGGELLKADPGARRMLSRVPGPSGTRSLGRESAEAFAAWFGARGLVVIEPHVVRGLAVDLFETDVRRPGVLAAAVRAGNALVRRAGFEAVLADPDGALHFRVDGDGVRSRGGGTEEDLADPEHRLSADVALRVLVQDRVLPVVAQVAGPSEAEYLAALGPAHEAAEAFRPAVIPRPGFTILERRIEEALTGFGVDLEGIYRDGAAALAAPAVAGEDPLAEETERLRTALRAAVGEAAGREASVRSRVSRADRALEELAAAARRAADERRGVGEGRRRRVLEALLPEGVPQERRWTLGPFLARHGDGLHALLAAACAGPQPGHRIVRPGEAPDPGSGASEAASPGAL